MILLPIVAGLVGGPGTGASMGFGAGLVADLFLPTPFGLSALVGCLIGFAVGSPRWPSTARPVAAPGGGLRGSALYEVIYAVLGSVLGQPQMIHVDLTRVVLVVAVVNAVLALPAMRLVGWALPAASTEGVPTSTVSSGEHSGERATGSRTQAGPQAGYWSAVSRSLRHPFKGSHHYLRAEKDRSPRRSRSKQPRCARAASRWSPCWTPPTRAPSRPGLRLRVAGLVVAGLFALLGLRLWALTVLQAPAAAQAVSVNQIRGARRAHPGPHPRPLGQPPGQQPVVQQITLSRSAAQEHPEVIGRLATLIGETTAQVQATIADRRYSPYKPVPIVTGGTNQAQQNAILSDILYISEHQDEFPGVSSVQTTERAYPQVELPGPAQGDYPASQTLGYVSTINAAELKAEAAKGYQAGDAYGQSGLEYQYESALRGTPGRQEIEVTPSGKVAGTVRTTPAVPGDNLVTNLDTNLQQVADNALAAQIAGLRRQYDKQCNNNSGCYPAATGGAVIVMSPQTGAVYAMSSYPSYNLAEWVGGLSAAQNAQLFGADNGEPSLNRAIEGQYIPGSTFKLNTATAALNTGLITPTFTYYDNNTFKTPDCQYNSTTCVFHNSDGDSPGTYNISSALTVSSDDFFYNLGYLFYAKSGPVRRHAHPGHRRPVRPGPADRHRPARRGAGPGGQPGRAGQAPRHGPQGLPEHHLVHGGQHRDGLRPGRHLHHAHRAGGGLRHLRQRRHPVRPAGGRRDRRPRRAGWSRSSPPRSPATSPSRRPTTRPCSPGSRVW